MRNDYGNDPAYSMLVTKTPEHPHWITIPLHPHAYTLDELLENLPAGSTEPVGRVCLVAGLGRNCTIFEDLRAYAYRATVEAKKGGKRQDEFAARLLDVASGMNQQFNHPLRPSEVRGIARSVGKWTWARFSPEKFSAIQRYLGAKRRWEGHISAEATRPWEAIGISRRTYHYRKKAGVL